MRLVDHYALLFPWMRKHCPRECLKFIFWIANSAVGTTDPNLIYAFRISISAIKIVFNILVRRRFRGNLMKTLYECELVFIVCGNQYFVRMRINDGALDGAELFDYRNLRQALAVEIS